jgi:hypothetical protein
MKELICNLMEWSALALFLFAWSVILAIGPRHITPIDRNVTTVSKGIHMRDIDMLENLAGHSNAIP